MKRIKPYIFSAALMVLTTLLLSAIAAWLMEKTGTVPESTLPAVTTGIAVLSAFIGGWAHTTMNQKQALLRGLAHGAACLLVIVLLSMVLNGGEFSVSGLWKGAAILLGGCLGGAAGVSIKKKIRI